MQQSGDNLHVVFTAQSQAAPGLGAYILPLLELCLAQTNSQGAYVYRLNRPDGMLELMAWRGLRPTEIRCYHVQATRRRDGGTWI